MGDSMIYELNNPPRDSETLLLHETLFHNANGYLGVRSCFEEGYPTGMPSIRGMYLNGFYDFVEMKQAEPLYGLVEEKQTILNIADAQGIALSLQGETFNLFTGEVLAYRRRLDMAAGTTSRHVDWRSPWGQRVRVDVRRMASFTRLPLFLMEYTVHAVDFSGTATLTSTHRGEVHNYSDPDDPRVASESRRHLLPVEAVLENGASLLTTATAKSGLTVCTAVQNQLTRPAEQTLELEGHGAVYTARVRLQPGQSVTLYKYCVCADSLRHADCADAVRRLLGEVLAQPRETLYQEQRDYLRAYWDKAFLEVDGVPALSQAVRFGLYQLLASAGKDENSNIPAKGLSGEGYEGHYFWDSEMYIQPFFNVTAPEITRSLLAYRHHILDDARENARRMGHRTGALYPWRTIMGRECSGYFPSGGAQYHINGDIAHAVVAYYLATDDLDFLAEMGAEILYETARLWLDTGVYCGGQFQIHEVSGPDEYTCLVNNNYYTNLAAQHNLAWAARVYALLEKAGRNTAARQIHLTPEEVAGFEQAARCMYLPYDEERGINPQDDAFLQKKRWDLAATPQEHFPLLLYYHPLYLYRHQVCKQADTVLAHCIFEDAQPEAVVRRSFDYYEPITTHDSSLSTCIFSIVASRLGLREKAYAYFQDAAGVDLFNTHKNTKDGIHTANMGGTYMAIVYGFGGLRIKEDGVALAPHLPAGWNAYRFRVAWHGSRLQVDVTEQGAVLALLSGDEIPVCVHGRAHRLRPGQPLSIPAGGQ